MMYTVTINETVTFHSRDITYLLDIVSELYKEGYSFSCRFTTYEDVTQLPGADRGAAAPLCITKKRED